MHWCSFMQVGEKKPQTEANSQSRQSFFWYAHWDMLQVVWETVNEIVRELGERTMGNRSQNMKKKQKKKHQTIHLPRHCLIRIFWLFVFFFFLFFANEIKWNCHYSRTCNLLWCKVTKYKPGSEMNWGLGQKYHQNEQRAPQVQDKEAKFAPTHLNKIYYRCRN